MNEFFSAAETFLIEFGKLALLAILIYELVQTEIERCRTRRPEERKSALRRPCALLCLNCRFPPDTPSSGVAHQRDREHGFQRRLRPLPERIGKPADSCSQGLRERAAAVTGMYVPCGVFEADDTGHDHRVAGSTASRSRVRLQSVVVTEPTQETCDNRNRESRIVMRFTLTKHEIAWEGIPNTNRPLLYEVRDEKNGWPTNRDKEGAWISQYDGNSSTPGIWHILRMVNGIQGDWAGEYKTADEALAVIQNEVQ